MSPWNEFIRLRFNQLPDSDVVNYLEIINKKEELNYTEEELKGIKKYFGADMRSMINYMQSSKTFQIKNMIIDDEKWENLIELLCNQNNKVVINKHLKILCKTYRVPLKTLLKDFINYIIRNYTHNINLEFLDFAEFIVHLQEINYEDLLGYSLPKLCYYIPKIKMDNN